MEDKLESLRRCIRRAAAKCPERLETLRNDHDAQDILTLNLTRAVQLCVDVAAHLVAASEQEAAPETMADSFDALDRQGVLAPDLAERMKRAIGFRNVAVHDYRAIDWEIVHAICRGHLEDFRAFARAVVESLSLDE